MFRKAWLLSTPFFMCGTVSTDREVIHAVNGKTIANSPRVLALWKAVRTVFLELDMF